MIPIRTWNERTKEVAYLLNPAFCGRLLYGAIRAHNTEANMAFPFALIYLVLPLILHKNTRNVIDSRTQFLVWIQRNEYLLIHFAERARQLVCITNEAVELLLQSGFLTIAASGELDVSHTMRAISETKFAYNEVMDCINKSKHIGKWFARTGKPEMIYISLGVRP